MRIGKRIAIVTALGAVGAALLLPASATARTYTYCGSVDNRARTCGPNNLFGAIWDKPRYGRTRYKLCVNPPGGGNKDCDRHRSNRRGYDAVNLYGRGFERGKHVITWRKGGRRIDRDSLWITRGEEARTRFSAD